MEEQQSPKSFTGRSRQRTTRRSVLLADVVSRWLITVGGIGTIVSVLTVALFLVWVVLPLFLPAEVSDVDSLDIARERLHHVAVDEYQVLSWILLPSGKIEVFRLDNGEKRAEHQLFPEGRMVSSSFLIRGDTAAFGLADGTIQLADIVFETSILDAEDLPPEVLTELETESMANYRDGVLEPTPGGQYRLQELQIEMGGSARVASGPIRQLAHVVRGDGPLIAALVEGGEPTDLDIDLGDAANAAPDDDSGDAEPEASEPAAATEPAAAAERDTELRFVAIAFEEDTNFLTGETTVEIDGPVDLPMEYGGGEEPAFLAVTGAGNEVYAAWRDGRLERVDVRDFDDVYVAEKGRLLPPSSGERLEVFAPILGGNTFLWGDTSGLVRAGFTVRLEDAEGELPELIDAERDPRETFAFVESKQLARTDATPLAMASSQRSRIAATGFADGEIRLFNVTNARELRTQQLPEEAPVIALVVTPKEDGLLAVTPERLYHMSLDPRYPEAGFSALFRPVWYEGYAEPQHTWQSSSASDDFEMKLGLMPLIFGTLKATVYSMLFGAPLALLAAVFTSEFLHGKVKGVIKPSIELMASLPSVVLGFLAALVFAPYIENVVPGTLALFFTLPMSFLLGAYFWQMLPTDLSIRFQRWRFLVVALMVPVGIFWAGLMGPLVESLLFAGDVKGWLDWSPATEGRDRFADATGGWMLMWLPLSALAVAVLNSRLFNPMMRAKGSQWDRRQFATADLAKFLASVVATFVLAYVLSWLLGVLGFDPRGGYVDTYVQRNALVVGFVMGFAIIPIIYTIAEDALSTVPEHLRSASLGAGATQWQTAVRIIIPTAMSGLFSALMIGLGRAVGETMIVLMAAGNTPVMEWNIFEGFRTLSANIAVELPEAVKGSTHYRTLFLAALVLFVMTFVVNTVAEVIRLRFRKRAYQL